MIALYVVIQIREDIRIGIFLVFKIKDKLDLSRLIYVIWQNGRICILKGWNLIVGYLTMECQGNGVKIIHMMFNLLRDFVDMDLKWKLINFNSNSILHSPTKQFIFLILFHTLTPICQILSPKLNLIT